MSNALKKIETAKAMSSNLHLRSQEFKKLMPGGNNPAVLRNSPRSRFTPEQKKTILETIKKMHKGNAQPCNKLLQKKCLEVLKKNGLAQNVLLPVASLSHYKRAAEIAILPGSRSGFTNEQKAVISNAIKKLHCEIKEPRPHQIRFACLKALESNGIRGNAKLSYTTLVKFGKELNFPSFSLEEIQEGAEAKNLFFKAFLSSFLLVKVFFLWN